jgi:hypothetical protein
MSNFDPEAGADQKATRLQTTPWVIDRTINLPFLATCATIMAAAVAFGTKTDERLSNLEQASRINASYIQSMSPKMERLDERTMSIRADLDDALDYRNNHSNRERNELRKPSF